MEEMVIRFRAEDQISPILSRMGSNGTKVLAGMEDCFLKVDSAMNNTSKSATQAAASLSKLSGDTSGMISQSRLLANSMSDEADKIGCAAERTRNKANIDSQAATAAKEFYNGLKNQISAADEVTDSMENEAAAALKVSEALEKTAQRSEQRAKKAEESAKAARSNAVMQMQ